MDLDNPKPEEIKHWMKINELNIITAADTLGMSKKTIFEVFIRRNKC